MKATLQISLYEQQLSSNLVSCSMGDSIITVASLSL